MKYTHVSYQSYPLYSTVTFLTYYTVIFQIFVKYFKNMKDIVVCIYTTILKLKLYVERRITLLQTTYINSTEKNTPTVLFLF